MFAPGTCLRALSETVLAASASPSRVTPSLTPPASVLCGTSRETTLTAKGPSKPLAASPASPPAGTNTSLTTGTPNARSTALLSASLSVTAPAGSSTPLGFGTAGVLRGSRRRRSAAKRARIAAARASRTGVVVNGTLAAASALAASSDFACRPDHWTLTGLSVLAAAAAMISQACAALGTRDRCDQDDQLVEARVLQHHVERAGK